MNLTFKISDSPPQPSITVEDLNTVLIKMRPMVRAAKVHAYRDMTRYIKRIRAKVEKISENSRLKQKLHHRISDLQTLRFLSVNRLSKLLLANEHDKDDLQQHGHQLTEQDRLLIRLGLTKPIAEFVHAFREEHSDWRSLVHYLLYKNISGKWKSREQKKRNRNVHGRLPLPPAPTLATEAVDGDPETSSDVVDHLAAYHVKQPSPNKLDLEEECDLSDSLPILPPPLDVDSDAASDIADELVSRLSHTSGKLKMAEHLSTSISNNSRPSELSNDGFCTIESNCMTGKRKKLTIHSIAVDKTRRKIKVSSKTMNVSPPSVHSMSKTEKCSLTELDDDNPLGSDHIDAQKTGIADRKRRLAARRSTTKGRIRRGSNRNRLLVGIKDRSTTTTTTEQQLHHVVPSPNADVAASPIVAILDQEAQPVNMHPSWLAKREKRLKQHSLVHQPEAQAKRIVFDD